MYNTTNCYNNDPSEYAENPTGNCPNGYNDEEDVECDYEIDLGYMDDECYSE